MATIRYEMTHEDRANALAEAKARGVPEGWRVELDVSKNYGRKIMARKAEHADSFLVILLETQTTQMDCSQRSNV